MKGITLKHFQKLIASGDDVKDNERIENLLQLQSSKKWKTKLIESMTLETFVDLERFLEDMNYIDFCRIFVLKNFWQTIYVHNLYSIVEDYGNKKAELFENYQYIFNPPQYGEPAKETIGNDLRKEFVIEFGNYVVLTDVICQHQNVSHIEVEKWSVERFLFWANYYSGQKIIENIK